MSWPSFGSELPNLAALQVCKFGEILATASEASATLRAIAAELQACIVAQSLLHEVSVFACPQHYSQHSMMRVVSYERRLTRADLLWS